jgi:flagellar biosynthesis protein FlhB
MAEGEEDRTEAATPRRLMRAREEGSVALSHELSSLAGLAGAAAVVTMLAPSLATDLATRMAVLLAHAGTFTLANQGSAALGIAAGSALRAAAPFLGVALLGGVGVSLFQTGLLFRPEAVAPDLGRISPGRWIRRIASADGLFEQGKSVVKLAVIGIIAWHVLVGGLPAIAGAAFLSPAGLVGRVRSDILALMMPMLAALALIAGLDILWVRLRHASGMRMSREEVRQEMKETEGDPHLKARMRQIRNGRTKRRMLGAVKNATVVVTNPTHYAVALAYERGKNAAPRVVAKGVDAMAARIREIAEAHRVPVLANPPLARALYQVEVDAEIAPEHYKAVAEIIAYVWRLGRGPALTGASAGGVSTGGVSAGARSPAAGAAPGDGPR